MEKIQKDNILCQICGEVAINICFECVMYLCDSCFKLIHDKTKNHKKESIDYFVPFSLNVQNTLKIELIFFVQMRKVNLFFYLYLYFIELFYSICYYNKMHNE